MENRIKVIDSPTGSGKTTYAINYINSLPSETKVIFITPFLSEVERVISACKSKNFVQPDKKFGKGSKMANFIELIKRGDNIVSTHALFTSINENVIAALKLYDYILILDEVMNVIEQFNLYDANNRSNDDTKTRMTIEDIITLKEQGILQVDGNGVIHWADPEKKLHKYEKLKEMADRELLYLINDTVLIWTFPILIFQEGLFSEIMVLTYLFNYQIQSFYYDYYGLNHSLYHIEQIDRKYQMIKTTDYEYDKKFREEAKKLITVCEIDSLNRIGSVYYDDTNHKRLSALSKNWYSKHQDIVPVLGKNAYNFFLHHTTSQSTERMWTTFKEFISILKNKNLSKKTMLELNARSTNMYRDKTALAYMVNRYPQPHFETFFASKGVELDRDGFAISEMVQWIYRSAVRDGVPISIYIPSERMRNLLYQWMNFYNKEYG